VPKSDKWSTRASFLDGVTGCKALAPFCKTCQWSRLLRKHQYSISDYATFFREGREIGFDYFFRELYPTLCLYAGRLCRDPEAGKDLASSAFMKVWDKHTELTSAEHIKRYLYRATRNECLSWLQAQHKLASSENQMVQHLPSFESDHLQAMITAEVITDLHKQLSHLPAACREVFTKLYVEGKTARETADELQLHISTVKTQKMRGLQHLRRSFRLG
jgi:RNA polymerase sigma-70 factor (ECF subfamily)